MPSFTVVAAEVAGHLEAKGDRPELDIHHYTLAQNGTESLAFRFARPSTALPTPGSVLEGDLGEQDRRDPERRKFMPTRSGGFGGGSQAKDEYWRAKDQRDVVAQARMGRAHSQEMALRYIIAKGKADFTFEDVQKLTDAFVRDLEGNLVPVSDVPFDATNLS